jgi:uncharacterized protein (DUF1501 family)
MNRRSFLAMTAGGLFLPRFARAAAPGTVERKFLFVFCQGGWDVTKVWAPKFDNPNVDMDPDDTLAEAGTLPYCQNPTRPNVDTFLRAYGDQCCVINGMEVRSITHERCLRISLTGSAETGRDDWGATLAGMSGDELLAPHLVVVGTAFTDKYTSKVVRVGSNGQLPVLLDGTALTTMADEPVIPPSAATSSAVDAYVRDRVAAYTTKAGSGKRLKYAENYATVLDQLDALAALSGEVNLTAVEDGCNRDTASDCAIALSCFELGISRCAMVRNIGWCEYGWDTHSDNRMQDTHYNQLFGYLSELMADLETRVASDGSPLKDHVTIVLMSEMGRTPKLNAAAGRDHWTYTSAVLIGAGVKGGQVVGALDDDFLGRPVDLASGEATDSGTRLVPGNLGATLLALADIDPADAGILDEPILAAME